MYLTRSLVLGVLACGHVAARDVTQIEVFTTTSQPIALGALASNRSLAITVTEVDGIERFDAALSDRLPPDLMRAQREVLQRLAALDKRALSTLQRTARGLALAAEWGIDRLPAIVFDRTAVIYGVVDVTDAWGRYRASEAASH